MRTNPLPPLMPWESPPARRMAVVGLIVKRDGVVVRRTILRDPRGDWA